MTTTTPPSTNSLLIRVARPGDAVFVAPLMATAEDLRQVAPDEKFPLAAEAVQAWIERRNRGYVIEQRGAVVGYAELVEDEHIQDRIWIGHMMVDPGMRGLGLGKALVDRLLEIAEHECDAREVSISAFADNDRALRCYRSCGFNDVGVHRAHDRDLVELNYRVPGRQVLLPRPIVLGTGLLTASALVAVQPPTQWSPRVAIPFLAAMTAVVFGAQAILPLRRDEGWRRFAKIAGYTGSALVVGLATCGVLSMFTEVDVRGAAMQIVATATIWTGLLLWVGRARVG